MFPRTRVVWLLFIATLGCGSPTTQPTGPDVVQPTANQQPETPEGKQDTEFLLKEARRLGNQGKSEESLAFAEKAVESDPKNVDALKLAAFANLMRSRHLMKEDRRPEADKLFFRAADLARRLKGVKPELNEHEQRLVSSSYYNEACAFALAEKPDAALKALQAALDAGYGYLDDVRVDPDLKIIRDRPKFQELLTAAEERIAEAKRQEAARDLNAFESFDFDFALPDLNGETVSLADFKDKILVVDFWGTWCPPCRREVPSFAKLHKKYAEQGVAIVGINYEDAPREEWRDRVARFVEKKKVPYPCLLGDKETQDRVPDLKVFPTTLFIDRKGVVRLKAEGYHDYAYLEAVVEQLLNR